MYHYEIIAKLPAAQVHEALEQLRKSEKAAYAMAIQTLAAQRKFRPVFVEKKPPVERHAWMQQLLGKPQNNAISANILSLWLTGAHSDLLVTFLDALGIKHDGKGGIEETPQSPTPEALSAAVDGLFAKFPAELVKAYLHTFQAADPEAWPPLNELLKSDARLAL